MPNPEEARILFKKIPTHVAWDSQVIYTFPSRDEKYSTDEIDAYQFPYSLHTFWVNFRISRFQNNGILRTDGIRVRLIVRTATEEIVEILPWIIYYSPSWYSMRWPLPSLPYANDVGIWLEMEHPSCSHILVEIQGFDKAYPHSDRYVVIDEEDRHVLLFQQEREVCTDHQRRNREKKTDMASIHDLYDMNLPATHGVSPEEVDGVVLFPLALKGVIRGIER